MAKITLRVKDDKDFDCFKWVLEKLFGATLTGCVPVPDEPGIEYVNFFGMQVAHMEICPQCGRQYQNVCPNCGEVKP